MKLDWVERGLIIFTVWLSAFWASYSVTNDAARAFGASLLLSLLGFGTIGSIHKHRERIAKKTAKKESQSPESAQSGSK